MPGARADGNLFAIVGAGPSLDYCAREIKKLKARGAKFLLSDSVAAGLFDIHPDLDAIVFTVEIRRHLYLARIGSMSSRANNESRIAKYMAYHRAHARNLRFTGKPQLRHFKILHEAGDLPELYSPGTVLGVMLSYAVNALAGKGEIFVLGADFSYIDNQVYSRFIDPHAPPVNRLWSRELWQYEMSLKKSSGVITKSGHAIRTAFELMQSRENMRQYLMTLPASIRVCEFSPIGFDSARVEKQIPESTNI